MALGHGGQTLLTFLELNLIVVSTANKHADWDIADAQQHGVLEIVSRNILPAIENLNNDKEKSRRSLSVTAACFFSEASLIRW